MRYGQVPIRGSSSPRVRTPVFAIGRRVRVGCSADSPRRVTLTDDVGKRPLFTVDEAHVIHDRAVFEGLRLLLNFASEGPPDLSLLLVGGAEVLLELPRGLADRLAVRCLLAPFTESETASYVLGRLAAAGATSPLFTPEALVELHREGAGLARRLNRLADMSLLIAYARELSIVDAETVMIAGREQNPDTLVA